MLQSTEENAVVIFRGKSCLMGYIKDRVFEASCKALIDDSENVPCLALYRVHLYFKSQKEN